MHIHQLRSATIVLTLGPHRLLVDPMLAAPGTLPGFKMFGGGRRANPLVPLPPESETVLAGVTGVVITHEHPDHFDKAALAWVRERKLPVWTNGIDAPSLRGKGLDVRLLESGALGMEIETVRSRHGRGLLGFLMGPVAGYYFTHPDEPSVYLVGDSVLTEPVLELVERLQPDVIVAPAGAANMGLGGDILFSVDELVKLAKTSRGQLVANHLEALDHCPTTRQGLRERLRAEGLDGRVHVPADGEILVFSAAGSAHAKPRVPGAGERPGPHKWLTAPFAGT